ncbi:MAG: uracil-DNA glycosylase [Flavobacteriales bacterium]
MNVNPNSSWNPLLKKEMQEAYFQSLQKFTAKQYLENICYPPQEKIFQAFDLCPLEKVKVVILGQDPYINPNQAMGLSFSVPEHSTIPPSLRNIFKELEKSNGIAKKHGDLTNWAQQGVFLLNTVLSVQAGNSNSHAGQGWETFTNKVIKEISDNSPNVVYMLWGAHAQKKQKLINDSQNLILKAPHPSPLSAYRGFFGCGHFTLCNEYLAKHNKSTIKW